MTLLGGIKRHMFLRHLTQNLSTEDARAFRITNGLQLFFLIGTTLLWPQVVFNEPPETHFLSTLLYIQVMVFLVIARIFLVRRQLLPGAAITVAGVYVHVLGLCAAYPDDPAHLGYFLLMLFPFLTFPARYRITRWVFVAIAALSFLGDQLYFRVLKGSSAFGPPKWIVTADYLLPPLILVVFFYILLVNTFVRAVRAAEDGLAKQHEASEKLLRNILPAEVANELKQHGVSEPRYFASTTVCFTDFAGFTQISESMAPKELVAELDRCFSYFDSVTERNNLEKLKTIGDSYMFAGGIPLEKKTHAVDAVMAALEIQAFMNQMKEIKTAQGLPYWELRLGIHSGDLVAGVIGEKKFAYDVWSDTVNTASRCESSGVSGKINISGATYALVKDFFACEYRGAVPAKHKGNIDMYFVTGLLPELCRDGDPRVPNQVFRERYAALAGGAA